MYATAVRENNLTTVMLSEVLASRKAGSGERSRSTQGMRPLTMLFKGVLTSAQKPFDRRTCASIELSCPFMAAQV
jgi:hypothetical protein